MRLTLDESLFNEEELPIAKLEEPIEVSTEVEGEGSALPGPEPNEETGIAELLMNLIKDEYEAIQGYNQFLVNIEGNEKFADMKNTIEHINTEENKHIGELTTLLNMISPNVSKQDEGEQEAKDEIEGE